MPEPYCAIQVSYYILQTFLPDTVPRHLLLTKAAVYDISYQCNSFFSVKGSSLGDKIGE